MVLRPGLLDAGQRGNLPAGDQGPSQTAGHQFIISPVEAHSKKPDEARDKIVSLLGDLPRVELFARQTPPGWDVWGNEVESTVPDFGTLCPKVGGPKGGLSCPM